MDQFDKGLTRKKLWADEIRPETGSLVTGGERGGHHKGGDWSSNSPRGQASGAKKIHKETGARRVVARHEVS